MKKYVFTDESGCMTFARRPNISRYFILCTVHLEPNGIGSEIMALWRDLAWNGYLQDNCIHAASDPQDVRDEVFALLQGHDFRIDATILEKSKAQPQIRVTDVRFYQYAWFYHFKHVGPRIFEATDEALICNASIGTSKKRAAFKSAIHDMAEQSLPNLSWVVTFWPANSDPCLLVADYCAWAIQRKWELEDDRSYALIQNKIATEFELWRNGTKHYY
ncbi:MAG: DUF3800 domain-containing protein [Chloroflexi bacterium]|nr:DUF3800 domain-containing protein [Chloroflexota bacterium]